METILCILVFISFLAALFYYFQVKQREKIIEDCYIELNKLAKEICKLKAKENNKGDN